MLTLSGLNDLVQIYGCNIQHTRLFIYPSTIYCLTHIEVIYPHEKACIVVGVLFTTHLSSFTHDRSGRRCDMFPLANVL